MQTINDVHQQFASFFSSRSLRPFAYLVSKKLAEGHICIDLREVDRELEENPFYAAETPRIEALASEPFVGDSDNTNCPFVLHNNKLYLQRYFQYESRILERLRLFAEMDVGQRQERKAALQQHTVLVQTLFPESALPGSGQGSMEPDWQLVAAVSGVINNFTIISGGPGTGKTTTVSRILAILFSISPGLNVALAASTGKAAMRMAESLQAASIHMPEAVREKFTRLVPETIHRLLGTLRNTHYFRHNRENPLKYDVVIVDESSMIDVSLFAKLLDAVGPATRLIMLGDKDQLASVEAGSMFGDLCASENAFSMLPEVAGLIHQLTDDASRQMPAASISSTGGSLLSGHIVELKHSHRFSAAEGIGRFSKAIIDGDQSLLQQFYLREDSRVIIDERYREAVFLAFVKGYKEYIRAVDIRTALGKLNALRVLCAVRDGEHGLHAINRRIEKYLYQQRLINPGNEFYEHRPIIVTRNYYELNLFNGDIGLLRYDENHVLKAFFDDGAGGVKAVLPGFLAEAETVYAMTIHKSQGSEYDQVLVILPDLADMPLLTAELLYTAVTRAKSKIVLQASAEVVHATVNRRVKRSSGIEARLANTSITLA